MATKTELRRNLKRARISQTDAEYTLKSRAISERLKTAVDWSVVSSLHYFEPIHDLLEVDISGLVIMLEDDYPQIQLFTPKLIGTEWEMISIKDTPAPEQFDIIIVPMLGFDADLQRIGYGGGYYDKFLANQPKAQKIGACFELGRVAKIPTEPHDIALDQIITETGMYSLTQSTSK